MNTARLGPGMAAYPIAEIQRLYATISSLTEKLKSIGEHGGRIADVVLMRAMGNCTLSRYEIAEKSGMSPKYVHERMYRLRAMGLIEVIGTVAGKRRWLWRKTLADFHA